LEASNSSTTSAASKRRSASMASSKPIKLPAKESGETWTSSGRPCSRSTIASHVGTEASGLVPAAVLNGDTVDLRRLDGGERERRTRLLLQIFVINEAS
jgi:hypothetical protein